MSTMIDAPEQAKGEGAHEDCRKQRNNVTRSGKVLSLLRANGEWLAVVQALCSSPGEPVLSKIVPISELKGSARRKADRWVEYLA